MSEVEIALPYNFAPRPYQIEVLRALDQGIKRVVLVWHRRSGKDLTMFNWVIKKLFTEVCTAFYIFPSYAQGKKAIWDAINIDGQRIIDYVPSELIKSKNQQEMKIWLKNGSLFQIIGSDNIDSLMGTNPKIVVFSEYAMQNPQAWDYIRPILSVNNGYAIFISTPRGKNHFHQLLNIARDNFPNWYHSVLTVDDTGVLTKEQIEKEKADGMSDEMALQEYYCSFDRGVEGSYYGKLIEKARQEKRIGNIAYDSSTVVHTAWDIGISDDTSIVFWQEVAGEIHIIDYYENRAERAVHYVKHIRDKPYLYGTHYLPHDAASRKNDTGNTYQQVVGELGLKTTIVPSEEIQIGIEMVRSLLSLCYFDATKCRHLLNALEQYHRVYNEKFKCYSEHPKHDWSSHAADAIRYMAMARKKYGKGNGGLTSDQIKEMRLKNYGY